MFGFIKNGERMKKELGIDKFIKNLISKYLFEICMLAMIFAATAIRCRFASETTLSPDYESYYKPWVDFYRENGIIKGLGNAIGDYYVPLNVLYALCSLLPVEPWIPLSVVTYVCEMLSACSIFGIFYVLTGRKHHSMFAGVATLFLPFVAFNGSLWKQVDSIYTCFILISIYHMLKQHYRATFIWYGVAFAVKLQSVIFLPVLIILYITEGFHSYDKVVKDAQARNSFSILEFLWIPAIYLMAGLPEVLCGNGLRRTYLSYLYQTRELDSEGYGMVSFFPNLYNLGFDDYDSLLSTAAIMLTFAVFVIITYTCYRKKENLDKRTVLYLAIWTAWTCVVLLPGMHERYDYSVLLLLTPFAILLRKKILWPMLIANICSLAVYARTLFRADDLINMPVVSLFYVAAYLYVTIDIMKLINGDTGEKYGEA
ncbi:hypothetical protein bhn_I0504 [Butyrivibrio hungatei]|uniref:Mannosyltransferase related to Gpi18 n=2 Tax=Butyrivibrio hungatei TaxID=185008 RepID=A0A1D9NYX9_9FIRM|nr:hypothetical protein bhn_I0504 [Butyrivibrio hungatei]